MTTIYDLLSSFRDIVNTYDAYIDRAKLWKGRVLAGNSRGIKSFLSSLESLIEKTRYVFTLYNNASAEEADDESMKYIKTYYSYLVLVSIPYIRDILLEIRHSVKDYNDGRLVEDIDKTIEQLNKLLSMNTGSSTQ